MKFQFKGGMHGETKVTIFGRDWSKGVPLDIHQTEIIENLHRHSQFEVVAQGMQTLKQVAAEAPVKERIAALEAERAKLAAELEIASPPSPANEPLVQIDDMSDDELERLTAPAALPPKRRGRQPGSKNKPKD